MENTAPAQSSRVSGFFKTAAIIAIKLHQEALSRSNTKDRHFDLLPHEGTNSISSGHILQDVEVHIHDDGHDQKLHSFWPNQIRMRTNVNQKQNRRQPYAVREKVDDGVASLQYQWVVKDSRISPTKPLIMWIWLFQVLN